MKKAQKKLSIPSFYITPIAAPELKKPNPLHRKFKSGRASPAQTAKGLKKIVAAQSKCNSKTHSPSNSIYNSPRTTSKFTVPSHIVKRQSASKNARKNPQKLANLEGKQIIRAPKIFDNQIFIDVYDEHGRHDRIVEIIESLNSERNDTSRVYSVNEATPVNFEGLKDPENSYLQNSRQETYNLFGNGDLMKKLEMIAKSKGEYM